jgi:hypothetical protein
MNCLLIITMVTLSGFLITSCKKEKTEINMFIKNWNLKSKTIAGLNIATSCENNSKWNLKMMEHVPSMMPVTIQKQVPENWPMMLKH